MANPYHDADGRFASRDELKATIATALKEERFDDYYRERKNFEEIEANLASSSDEMPTFGGKVVVLGTGDKDTWDAYNENQDDRYYLPPSSQNQIPTYAVLDTSVEDTLGHDPDSVYLCYEASATQQGLEDYERAIDLKSVMSDTREISIPQSVEAIDMQESRLLVAKKRQAENYREWRKQTEKGFDLYRNMGMSPTESSMAFKREILLERDKLEGELTSAKGDFAYHSHSMREDAYGYNSYGDNAKKITEAVLKIQSTHDGLIFNRLKQRKLDAIED